MKKIVGFTLVIILISYLLLLSKYLMIEEIIGLFIIQIIVVVIISSLIYLIIFIFKAISYKNYIVNSLLAACSLQIVIVSLILWSATPRYFSREQVTNDIDYAVKLMEDVHPNFYAIISKDAFYSKTDSIKKSLPEKVSEAEAFRTFEMVFSQIHDAHTGVNMMNFFIKRGSGPFRKILPYKLKIENERIFVAKNYFYRNTIPIGSEIIKINGKPTSLCLKEISQLISFENISYRNAQLQNPFLWGFWNGFKVFEITYKTSDNKTIKTIKSSGGIISKILFSKENKTSGKAYSYKTIAGNIGYIEFNSFENLDKFKSFLEFTFKSIKSNNVKELILDIRRNEGGNNSLGDELMQYISKSDFRQFDSALIKISNEYLLKGKLNWVDSTKRVVGTMYNQIDSSKTKLRDNPLRFVGQLYLLIGGNTFSSASDFASSFQCYKAGKIIGTETGGLTAAYFSNKYTFKLPNTKLDMGVSDKKFFNSCGIDNRRGVIPDYTVENSIEDEQNGIDRVLKFTIDLIKQNKE
jgi:C-terminal processing protease CtpA/Prc